MTSLYEKIRLKIKNFVFILPFNENKKGFHIDNPECEVEVPYFVRGLFFVRCRINKVLPAAGYAPSAGFAGNDRSHLTPAE